MAVIIDMDKPDNCHDCPMCEASRLPFWCMALSEKLPFDRNEIYKSIASDCPLKSTADVQPVIHAKWIMRGGRFRCSNCDALSPLTKGWEDGCRTYTHSKTKFCSECGAKMNQEEEENE